MLTKRYHNQRGLADAHIVIAASVQETDKKKVTYAEKLKAQIGPAVAAYPTEKGAELKTVDDTKSVLKTSIAPAALNIKVDQVRCLAGAGVFVLTRTREDLEGLKSAIPPTLMATEPKKRQPLMALRNVEGKADDFAAIVKALHEQNFKDDKNWTLEKMNGSCKNRYGGERTTVVMACDPKLRRALLDKGKVNIGWEVVTMDDFTTAFCCRW